MVNRQELIGRPRHDHPKDQWRAYRPVRTDVGRRGGMAVDYEAQSAVMDGDPLADDQISKARLTAAHWFAKQGLGAEELTETLHMLGIHPDDDLLNLDTLGPNNLPNPHTPAPPRVTQK